MYGFSTPFHGSVEDAVSEVTAALKEEGFGVLTEIDVQATLKAKLGVERRPYHILGACNPALANRAIEHDPDIGLLLPCNVVVREDDDGVKVLFIDPRAMLGVTGDDALNPIADDVRERLERVKAALAP